MSRRCSVRFAVRGRYLWRVLLGALALPGELEAQGAMADSTPRVSFRVGGGFADQPPLASHPIDGVGYHVQAGVEVGLPVRGLHLRSDALLSQWSRGAGGSVHQMGALSAALVARAPARWRAAPYVLGGVGGYAVNARFGAPAPGWTLGAGLELPLGRRALFLESRLHAFNLGGRTKGTEFAYDRNFGLGIAPWQYTMTPLSVGFRF